MLVRHLQKEEEAENWHNSGEKLRRYKELSRCLQNDYWSLVWVERLWVVVCWVTDTTRHSDGLNSPLYPKIGGPHSNSSQIECKKTRTTIYKVRELQLWCMDRQVRRYIIYWVASVILSQFTLVGKYDGVERNFSTIKSKGKMTSRTSWWIETWFCHCPIQC